MICSSVYRLFFIVSSLAQITRELQIQLGEIAGSRSLETALPDLDSLDLEAMKALVIAQHERYTRTLSSRATEIERLTLSVEKLKHMLFGRKSEKVLRQIEQLEFQIEDLQAASAIEEMQAPYAAEQPVPAKPFRRPLPEHLPREIHTHMPGHESCPDLRRSTP